MRLHFSYLAALLFSVMAYGVEYPFGTTLLGGGRVEPVSMKMIESSNEHLNFCFATRFSDNSIYLSHSAGIHTVTEHGCKDYSLDNGETWQKPPCNFGGFNAYEDKQGRKITIGCWDAEISTEHQIERAILSADGKSTAVEYSTIKMPFKSSLRLHREVLRMKSGRLMLTGYIRKENAPKYASVVIVSDDDGKTWRYHSTILEDLQARYAEGPNECAVIELANGDILAYVRVASQAPLLQLRSKDGGLSWHDQKEIAKFCVAPAARILANGALVVITGRPKLYLLIDFTGTGEHYQRFTAYSGSGSSYASILETAPNQLLVIYDESDFGSWRNNGIFSRIMAMKLNIVRDDSISIAASKKGEFETYYISESGRLPTDGGLFSPSCYLGKSVGAYYEVRNIAERPHPVLHLEHKGKDAPQKFANFAKPFTRGASKISAGFEFRLTEPAEKSTQFMVRFCFDDPDTDAHRFGWVAFGINEIAYQNNGTRTSIKYKLDTDFHAFTLKGDLKSGKYQLFRKGSDEPIFTGALTINNDVSIGFNWGDGATEVFGGADVSYIGFTIR